MPASKVRRPEPHEMELIGRFIRKDGRLASDDTALRITALLRDWFKLVAEKGRERCCVTCPMVASGKLLIGRAKCMADLQR
jgi:hypothetical protein